MRKLMKYFSNGFLKKKNKILMFPSRTTKKNEEKNSRKNNKYF